MIVTGEVSKVKLPFNSQYVSMRFRLPLEVTLLFYFHPSLHVDLILIHLGKKALHPRKLTWEAENAPLEKEKHLKSPIVGFKMLVFRGVFF